MIPVERLRAMIRLLYPQEMTPMAKRMLEKLCVASECSCPDAEGVTPADGCPLHDPTITTDFVAVVESEDDW